MSGHCKLLELDGDEGIGDVVGGICGVCRCCTVG